MIDTRLDGAFSYNRNCSFSFVRRHLGSQPIRGCFLPRVIMSTIQSTSPKATASLKITSLVDYPSSSSEDEDKARKQDFKSLQGRPTTSSTQSTNTTAHRAAAKRKRAGNDSSRSPTEALPPLPPAFRDLYAFNARASPKDDPELHGGRKRITPHVDGHWPTHIYLECKFFMQFDVHMS